MSEEIKRELEADEAAAVEAEYNEAPDVSQDGQDPAEDAAGEAEPGEDEADEESEDSLTYSNGVIEKIVALAVREVPHVLGMKGNLVHFMQERFGAENLAKGVSVEVTDDNRVIVNVSVIIEYGAYAPQIFEDVKVVVADALERMTGLEIAGINLRIEDVLTREEYEGRTKSAPHEPAEA